MTILTILLDVLPCFNRWRHNDYKQITKKICKMSHCKWSSPIIGESALHISLLLGTIWDMMWQKKEVQCAIVCSIYVPLRTYLIFVTNAANAVRVKFLAECKKIPEKRENYCFGLRLYHNSDHVNVLFYTKCAILHRYQCFILHLVFDFTLGV